MILRALVSALVCGACAVIAIAIVHLLYGEETSSPKAARAMIAPILSLVLLGAWVAWQGLPMSQIALIALLGIALTGAWYADVVVGKIPDLFTALPLTIAVGRVIVMHFWINGLAGLVFFVIFGAAALATRGRGVGWGDAKLATFAAMIIGFFTNLLVLGVACFSAVAVSVVRNRGTQPITFAPYIAAWTLLYIALTVRRY